MRRFLLAAAVAALLPSAADAATWVAVCNDGKNIQYNQTLGGAGLLYMKTTLGIYQIAHMTQTFSNGIAVCASVDGNGTVTQICANKSTNIIYLKYKNPTVPGSPIVDGGTFCTATVTVH